MTENQNVRIRKIISALRQYDRFIVATHVRPDGDAIGSVLGMRLILQRLGKDAVALSRDGFPPEFEFLAGTEHLRSRPPSSGDYDAAILVDCGDFDRVGNEISEFIKDRVPFVINIDHHSVHVPFGNICWTETAASSTCEMLFDICAHLSLPLDAGLASLLYAGILTDTGSFRFANTSRRVFEIASMLVEAGADPVNISRQVYDSGSPEKLNLLARVLGTIEFHCRSRIATAELTLGMLSSTATTYMDSEGFINHLRSVKSVDLAILFREGSDGLIHVSLRSKGEIDVAGFAQRHGGGGHRQAAAFRIPGNLNMVRSMLTNEAVSYIG
jgi:phosphoesterase RecJ-like protein